MRVSVVLLGLAYLMRDHISDRRVIQPSLRVIFTSSAFPTLPPMRAPRSTPPTKAGPNNGTTRMLCHKSLREIIARDASAPASLHRKRPVTNSPSSRASRHMVLLFPQPPCVCIDPAIFASNLNRRWSPPNQNSTGADRCSTTRPPPLNTQHTNPSLVPFSSATPASPHRKKPPTDMHKSPPQTPPPAAKEICGPIISSLPPSPSTGRTYLHVGHAGEAPEGGGGRHGFGTFSSGGVGRRAGNWLERWSPLVG